MKKLILALAVIVGGISTSCTKDIDTEVGTTGTLKVTFDSGDVMNKKSQDVYRGDIPDYLTECVIKGEKVILTENSNDTFELLMESGIHNITASLRPLSVYRMTNRAYYKTASTLDNRDSLLANVNSYYLNRHSTERIKPFISYAGNTNVTIKPDETSNYNIKLTPTGSVIIVTHKNTSSKVITIEYKPRSDDDNRYFPFINNVRTLTLQPNESSVFYINNTYSANVNSGYTARHYYIINWYDNDGNVVGTLPRSETFKLSDARSVWYNRNITDSGITKGYSNGNISIEGIEEINN